MPEIFSEWVDRTGLPFWHKVRTAASIMRKSLRTSASWLVLALALVALTPRPSEAKSIPFSISPGASVTIDDSFTNLNDVALFHFIIEGGPYNFSALTKSEDIGGFDPNLALYKGTELYVDADVPAVADDIIGVDAMLAFILAPGAYTLALAHSQNEAKTGLEFTWDAIDDVIGKLYDGKTCAEADPEVFNPSCGSAAFSVTLDITPVNAPVPEPGTLSLLALGSLATAAVRRRRNRRVMTRQ